MENGGTSYPDSIFQINSLRKVIEQNINHMANEMIIVKRSKTGLGLFATWIFKGTELFSTSGFVFLKVILKHKGENLRLMINGQIVEKMQNKFDSLRKCRQTWSITTTSKIWIVAKRKENKGGRRDNLQLQ